MAFGGSGSSSPLTTKGDIYGFTTHPQRIPVGADGQTLIADSTVPLGVKWASSSGYPPDVSARAHLSAPFPASAQTPIQWDTVDYDTASFFNLGADPEKITIPQTGKYQLGSNIQDTANAAVSITYSVNGVISNVYVTSNDGFSGGLTDQIELAAGDVVRILYSNTGGGAATDSSVWIKRVA